jgi:hypothetical protein
MRAMATTTTGYRIDPQAVAAAMLLRPGVRRALEAVAISPSAGARSPQGSRPIRPNG